MLDQGKGSLLPSSAFQPSQRVRIQLLFTQHVLLHFPYFPAVLPFTCFAESFQCLWGEGVCLLRVPRDNSSRLLGCWEMGQGPSGMAVPFVGEIPDTHSSSATAEGFSVISSLTATEIDQSYCERPHSAFLSLVSAVVLSFYLWKEVSLFGELMACSFGCGGSLWSFQQGFYITQRLQNSAGENTVVRQCGAWRCWGKIYNWNI